MQAHGYVRPREMQSARDLRGLAVFQVAEPHDIAEGGRQLVDHLEQHARQFAEVQGRLGGRGLGQWSDPRLRLGRLVVDGGYREPVSSFRHEAVCRLVAYDGGHPRACGRTALVLPELLQHDDPALLERVDGRRVIACDSPGEREEPSRAASDPRFSVLLEERTPDRFMYRQPRRRWLRHAQVYSCTTEGEATPAARWPHLPERVAGWGVGWTKSVEAARSRFAAPAWDSRRALSVSALSRMAGGVEAGDAMNDGGERGPLVLLDETPSR